MAAPIAARMAATMRQLADASRMTTTCGEVAGGLGTGPCSCAWGCGGSGAAGGGGVAVEALREASTILVFFSSRTGGGGEEEGSCASNFSPTSRGSKPARMACLICSGVILVVQALNTHRCGEKRGRSRFRPQEGEWDAQFFAACPQVEAGFCGGTV